MRVLAGALVCLLAPLALRGQGLPAGERLGFADGLYSRGMYDLAAKEYEGILASSTNLPSEDVVQFRLGECYRHAGDRVAAEKAFRRVFTGFPKSSYRLKAGFRRADLFMETRQYAEAIDLFRAVLREKPDEELASASAYFLGEALIQAGRTNEATEAYSQVRAQYPNSKFNAYALLKLGEICAAKPDREAEALQLYQAVADKPTSDRVGAEALFQMAEMNFRRKAYDRSAEAYRKLLGAYPSDARSAEARLQSAWAAHNAGLYAEALSRCDAALATNAVDRRLEWLYLKANCQRQLLKGEDAVRTYAELLRTCSGCEYEKAAQYETALTFYRMGKYAEAVDAALRVKLDPSVKKDAYWLLAESYAGLGKEDEAIQYYGLLLRDFPDSDVSCDATYRLAHHLQKRGENKEASRYYDELAATFPKSDLAPQALYASALCLVQERMFEEAIRDWSTLVRTYPSHSLVEESLYRKAMAEIRARQDREAAATLDELLKRFPKTRYLAEARYWLGVLLAGAGKLPEAEEQLRQAAQAGPGPELTRRCEYQLAVTLQKEQKFKEAAERFQKLLGAPQEDEFSPALLEWLAGFRCENGAYKEALAAARLLIARYSEPAWQQIGWGLAGRASLGEGDRAGAQQAFSRAMEQKATTPLAAESSLRLGELMLATNRLADAERHFQDAARLSSDDSLLGIRVRAYHGLALAAKAAGNGQEAARYFMSVAVLFDDPELVPESLYEAAAAYRSIGNDPDSKKALDELVKRYPQSAWAKRAAPQGSP